MWYSWWFFICRFHISCNLCHNLLKETNSLTQISRENTLAEKIRWLSCKIMWFINQDRVTCLWIVWILPKCSFKFIVSFSCTVEIIWSSARTFRHILPSESFISLPRRQIYNWLKTCWLQQNFDTIYIFSVTRS